VLFPEVTLDQWLKKYPELEVIEGFCDHCGEPLKAVKPFITNRYAGIMAPECRCGKNRHSVMSLVTNSYKTHLEWESILQHHF
jgi:hypothetical protein